MIPATRQPVGVAISAKVTLVLGAAFSLLLWHIGRRTPLPFVSSLALGVESELREALINLIVNAVDAMVHGGLLTLRTGVMVSGEVYVEIGDAGQGMS